MTAPRGGSGPASSPTVSWRPGFGSLLFRAVILSLPVVAFYAAQFFLAPHDTVFSGFIEFDMATYTADAHQYVDAPGTLAYANPFDWNPASPRIYFQPLIWLLGQIMRLGIGPAVAFVTMGLMATVCAMIVLQLLLRDYQSLPRPMAAWILLLAAWGGGLMMLGHLLTGHSLDPGDGFWFLNLGRNFIYPTEAFYHLLTLLLFWLVLRRRNWLVLGTAILLAISHPFTGAQYAAIVLVWAAIEWWAGSKAIRLPQLAAFTLPLLIVVGYYLVYLPSFPSHASVAEQWALDWGSSWGTQLAAYAPVTGFAAHRLWRDRHAIGTAERFMIVAAIISFGLSNHDLIITPRQPLHFTRGHVWFPLFLLGIPSMVALARYLAQQFDRRVYIRWMVLITFVALFDNLSFFAYRMQVPTGIFVSESSRELLGAFAGRDDSPIVLTRDLMSAYLLPTYTSARPFLSHQNNTPEYEAKRSQARRFMGEGVLPPELTSQCVVAAFRRGEPRPPLSSKDWSVATFDDWILFERKGASCTAHDD